MKLYRQCLREASKKPEVRYTPIPPFHVYSSLNEYRAQDSTFAMSLGKLHYMLEIMVADGDRREFQKNRHIDKKDFSAVETLVRMGQRKLELYSMPSVTDIH